MSDWSRVTVTFAEPIVHEGRPGSTGREFHVNLGELGIRPSGYSLIDRFNLPLVSHPHALADWSREITEAEYLDIVGPPDIESMLAKHPGLRRRMEWRSEPGQEDHCGQIEQIFHLVSEFKRGNRALRYRLTVSDMG
ncbi:hypothetical protein [Stenotrophomonas indicatrix]|uniref:hypothetical protein n=1 Tax=Stenotrophomonas indicatrix TaxID=2045451 RepID=UPI0013DA6B2F|nr:hypothetical protein [Stenotrophomonas indicatrix]